MEGPDCFYSCVGFEVFEDLRCGEVMRGDVMSLEFWREMMAVRRDYDLDRNLPFW